MILAEIKDYLKTNRQATLADMANRFDTQPDALRGMLAKWQAKGKVTRVDSGPKCDGCTQCGGEPNEVYLWLD